MCLDFILADSVGWNFWIGLLAFCIEAIRDIGAIRDIEFIVSPLEMLEQKVKELFLWIYLTSEVWAWAVCCLCVCLSD